MLTVDKIVADKLKLSTKKEEKTLKLEVPRLKELFGDGEIEIRVPDMELLASIGEREGDAGYAVLATLKSPDLGELMKALGVSTKEKALKKLFTKDELYQIAGHIGNNMPDVNVKLKNS